MVRKKSTDGSGSPTLSRQPSLDMPGTRSPKTSGKIILIFNPIITEIYENENWLKYIFCLFAYRSVGAISAWGAKAKAASGSGGQAKKKSGFSGKMKGKLVKAASQWVDYK